MSLAGREHGGGVGEHVQLMLDSRAVLAAGERGRALRVVRAPPVAADQPVGHQPLERAGDLLRRPAP
jgi:hypothetical protein